MSVTNFNTYIARAHGLLFIYEELGRKKVFLVRHREDSMFDLFLRHPIGQMNLSLATINFLERVTPRTNHLEKMEIMLTSAVVGNGPKVFRPNAETLKLLEEVTLNVAYESYNQPFSTMVFEIPQDYARAVLQVGNPLAGQVICGDEQKDKDWPSLFILHNQRDHHQFLMTAMIMNQGMSIKNWWAPATPEIELERWFENPVHSFTGETVTQEETLVEMRLRRACLNYVMLIEEAGLKEDSNPRLDKLKKLVKKSNQHKDSNTQQLRACPVYYSLDRKVKLFNTVSSHEELGESTGRTTCPHHRKGHYRKQRYGEGLLLNKRIRIPPVFVNAARFLGNMADARTTYVQNDN